MNASDTNDKIIDNLIHMTGWHAISYIHDLSHWQYHDTCAPLDAPSWIAGGSMVENSIYMFNPTQPKMIQRGSHRDMWE